jgi:hypothetical protein
MGPWVALAFVPFVVSSLVIGIRLLLLWRRTRELPELMIACGILGIGPVGLALHVASSASSGTHPGLASFLLAAALLCTSAGAFAAAIFNWRVFHPDAEAIRMVIGALGLGFIGAFLWEAVTTGFTDFSGSPDGFLLYATLSSGILLWGSAESLRYFIMMRRRAKLGLADPLVTNRFLLWGVGIGAAGVGSAISVTTQTLTGQPMLEVPWLMVSNSLHGLTAAVLMWVAFIPPGFYRRFVESRSQQPAA